MLLCSMKQCAILGYEFLRLSARLVVSGDLRILRLIATFARLHLQFQRFWWSSRVAWYCIKAFRKARIGADGDRHPQFVILPLPGHECHKWGRLGIPEPRHYSRWYIWKLRNRSWDVYVRKEPVTQRICVFAFGKAGPWTWTGQYLSQPLINLRPPPRPGYSKRLDDFHTTTDCFLSQPVRHPSLVAGLDVFSLYEQSESFILCNARWFLTRWSGFSHRQ